MYDLVYSKIDEFLKSVIKKDRFYIQEGSGGYYIASREGDGLAGGKFINRIAQIIEEEGEYRLSVKDSATGQWGEYQQFTDIDECLSEMEQYLLSTGDAEPVDSGEGDNTMEKPTELKFQCWSCGTVLLQVNANGSGLDVAWAEDLNLLEFSCPGCKKAIVFDLSNKKDLELVISPGKRFDLLKKKEPGAELKEQSSEEAEDAERNAVQIDFYDLLWRLKDHSYSSVHYLNMLTGRLEKVTTKDLTSRKDMKEYDGFPWLRITPIPSREAYGVMEEFVVNMEVGVFKEKLEAAIVEDKPFKGFKKMLQEYPEIMERWTEHENKFYMDKAEAWLNSVNINYKLAK